MKTKVVRLGVIGVGNMGKNHVRVLQSIPGVSVVAVADPDSNRLRAVDDGFSMVQYLDPYALFSIRPRLDGVVIASPTSTHFHLASTALRMGIPTLVEKPICDTLDEARLLLRVQEETGTPLMVGHVERFNPAVAELRSNLVLKGEDIAFVATRRSGMRGGVHPIGVARDLAIHDVDVINWLVGFMPTSVHASMYEEDPKEGNEDLLTSTIEYEDGSKAFILVDWLSPRKVRELRLHTRNGKAYELDYIEQSLRCWGPDGAELAQTVIKAEPLSLELTHFVWGLRNPETGPFMCTGEDGLEALYVVDAMLRSAADNQTVRLEGPYLV